MTRWMRQAGPHSDNFKLQGVIGYGGCTPSKNDGMQVHQHASQRECQTLEQFTNRALHLHPHVGADRAGAPFLSSLYY